MQYITITDYLLLPLVLFIVFILASYYRNKHYPPKHPLRKYFMWGFTVKIVGALFVGWVYVYYYKGGDTLNFWDHTVVTNEALGDSIGTWIKLVTGFADPYDIDVYPYTSRMLWYTSPAEHLLFSVGAVLGVFTLTTYFPTSVLLAALSFVGVWRMFVVFTKLYPRLIKQMAFAVLFVPSVVVWGSGFLKDTITFSCLGMIMHYLYLIFYENKKIFANSVKCLLFLYIVFVVKSYIMMAFVPAMLLWSVGLLSYKIKNQRLIIVARYLLYGLSIGGLVIIGGKVQEQMFGEYNVESVAFKSMTTRNYLIARTIEYEGSGYDLGDIDPTLTGMMEKAPAAINATLFRPYLWEARKPIVMLSALEAVTCLVLTIMALFRNNPIRMLMRVFSDETLQLCLIFTLVFAFAVGISTSNFGTLSRYKIPCMPFYFAFLFILLNPPKEELVLREQRNKRKRLAT